MHARQRPQTSGRNGSEQPRVQQRPKLQWWGRRGGRGNNNITAREEGDGMRTGQRWLGLASGSSWPRLAKARPSRPKATTHEI